MGSLTVGQKVVVPNKCRICIDPESNAEVGFRHKPAMTVAEVIYIHPEGRFCTVDTKMYRDTYDLKDVRPYNGDYPTGVRFDPYTNNILVIA